MAKYFSSHEMRDAYPYDHYATAYYEALNGNRSVQLERKDDPVLAPQAIRDAYTDVHRLNPAMPSAPDIIPYQSPYERFVEVTLAARPLGHRSVLQTMEGGRQVTIGPTTSIKALKWVAGAGVAACIGMVGFIGAELEHQGEVIHEQTQIEQQFTRQLEPNILGEDYIDYRANKKAQQQNQEPPCRYVVLPRSLDAEGVKACNDKYDPGH